ncbi:uncharacterized protein LOC118750316 [Rhagoletis pomonella]|uniref:uncharacterized protein LOC118750316 n=1 Tax=Rhagoletis pomonella TaxID=28610 RepID=UPI00177ADA7B|nr:uncharacterized protein LOC118750316 [Rhagoletis pomonella]
MVNNDLYNEDELNPPDWLNKEFFEKILKSEESDNVKVTDLELRPGTLKNDHYASVMFRAKLSYSVDSQPTVEKRNSFILKVQPFADGTKKDLLSELHTFTTEIRMYTEVLPVIERELRQYGDETILGPKLIAFSNNWPAYVVFEDLALKGYTTTGYRHASLTEVKAALLKLAKLHAISYKLSQEKNNIFATMNKGSMNSMDPNNFDFIKNASKLLKEVLSEHGDLRKYVPHIESVEHTLLPKIIDMFNENRNGKCDGIFVLNHGDFHNKNMMICNVDGELKDLMLVGMHRVGENRLFLITSFLVFSYGFVDENGDLAQLVENAEAQKRQLQDPRLLNELRELLPKFLYNGYFEY